MTSDLPDSTGVLLICHACGQEIKTPGQWVMLSGYPYHQQCFIPPVWQADRPAPATMAEIVAAAEEWVTEERLLNAGHSTLNKVDAASARFISLVAAHEAEVAKVLDLAAIRMGKCAARMRGCNDEGGKHELIDEVDEWASDLRAAAALRRRIMGG